MDVCTSIAVESVWEKVANLEVTITGLPRGAQLMDEAAKAVETVGRQAAAGRAYREVISFQFRGPAGTDPIVGTKFANVNFRREVLADAVRDGLTGAALLDWV